MHGSNADVHSKSLGVLNSFHMGRLNKNLNCKAELWKFVHVNQTDLVQRGYPRVHYSQAKVHCNLPNHLCSCGLCFPTSPS